MVISVAEGFEPGRDAFGTYWAALWSLAPDRRIALLDHVLAFYAAGSKNSRDAQVRIVETLNREFQPDLDNPPAVLDVLAYLGRLREVSVESDPDILEALEGLGYLKADDPEESREFLRRFFRALPKGGSGDVMA